MTLPLGASISWGRLLSAAGAPASNYPAHCWSEILELKESFLFFSWILLRTGFTYITVKVKCTLVQALRLCTGRTAHRGSRGMALPFHDYGTRRGWGVSVTPPLLFTPGKEPVPIVQEAGGRQGRSGQMQKISPPPDSIPGPSSP